MYLNGKEEWDSLTVRYLHLQQCLTVLGSLMDQGYESLMVCRTSHELSHELRFELHVQNQSLIRKSRPGFINIIFATEIYSEYEV